MTLDDVIKLLEQKAQEAFNKQIRLSNTKEQEAFFEGRYLAHHEILSEIKHRQDNIVKGLPF